MALEEIPDVVSASTPAGDQGGGLDALIAGLAGIIVAFSCGCLAPFMLVGNLLGFYVAFRSRGTLRWLAMATNLVAILLELLMAWLFWG
ncbi:MAG: hypothetical protein MK108_14965 [Mariniblastus sp.]|nr:hypothetical protein [Mariniblastus sp.]